ncbi:MAG: autoinducer binding domain-containing protein [Henriciella sp.]|nr:autoinducer binding domain-containing protein [Henriciella sp.]
MYGGLVGAALKYLRIEPAFPRQSLAAEIARSEVAQDILDLLVDYVATFGATWIMLGHIVNPDRYQKAMPLKLTNIRLRFLEDRLLHQAIVHDPVLYQTLHRSRPFYWHDVLPTASTEGIEFLRLAHKNGLKAGMTFPMILAGRPLGAVSIAGEHFRLDPDQVDEAETMLGLGYRRLDEICGPYHLEPKISLSVLETEVLHFAASGKSSWETATILGKTETSVSAAIKRAVRKLNAANRTEAVAKALTQRLIL